MYMYIQWMTAVHYKQTLCTQFLRGGRGQQEEVYAIIKLYFLLGTECAHFKVSAHDIIAQSGNVHMHVHRYWNHYMVSQVMHTCIYTATDINAGHGS